MELLYFISLAIFLIYILVILVRFGVPTSISESAYLFGKNGSVIFHGVFIAFILPLLIFWLDITDGQPYQFIVFISCAALCFTGITGRFKGDDGNMSKNIHIYATLIAAILSQLWVWISIPGSWMWSLIAFPVAFIIGYFVKGVYRRVYYKSYMFGEDYVRTKEIVYGNVYTTKPYNRLDSGNNTIIFWVEIALFFLTYVSIIVYENVS